MKIAILVSGFPVQGYLKDLVDIWRSLGHEVVVFRTSADAHADTAVLQGSCLRQINNRDFFYRGIRRLERFFISRVGKTLGLSIPVLAARFMRTIRHEHFDLLLGVEKLGVIIAHRLHERLSIPYAYYSLELYIEGHPWYSQFAYLSDAERKAQKSALATIIQDARRADVMSRANGLQGHRYIYLPVGARDISNSAQRSSVNRDGIDANGRFVILFVGLLSKRRRIDEIASQSASLGSDEFLYLHGPAALDGSDLCGRRNLILSTGILSEDDLSALIAASSVGVALYHNSPINDRLTAFSSHKIAMYLQHGKPVIVPHNESYADLLAEFNCGVMINDISELPAAVQTIRNDYAAYSDEARRAFLAHYDLNRSAVTAIDQIVAAMDSDERKPERNRK